MCDITWYWMMMLIWIFCHENNMQNSAVKSLSEVCARENTSCQMQIPRSDLTSRSYNKVVWFIISACVALWNSCALILTLDLLLSLQTVKILSAQKWKTLFAMPFFKCIHDLKNKLRTFKLTYVTGRTMILMSLLQETEIQQEIMMAGGIGTMWPLRSLPT